MNGKAKRVMWIFFADQCQKVNVLSVDLDEL